MLARLEGMHSKRLYMRIFKIVAANNISFTRNDNGIFFDFATLPDALVAQVARTIDAYAIKRASIIDFSDTASSDCFGN